MDHAPLYASPHGGTAGKVINSGCLPQGDLRAALTADKEGKYGWYGRGRGIALDIAAGVASLHSHKITHRDLKSPNILLDKVCLTLWRR